MVLESMKNRIHRVQLKAVADRSEAALNRCALTING